MQTSVFTGKWICGADFAALTPQNVFHREGPHRPDYAHDGSLSNRHMLVRHTLILPAEYHSVRIRLTADDYYKLWVNGSFIGQGPAPGYHFCYYYNELDLTAAVHAGENLLYLDVYYQGLINRVWNSADNRQGMIADIMLDGQVIDSTDETWEYTDDPRYPTGRKTGYDTQYLEDFDSRLQPTGWRPACVRETDYTFSPEPQPPICVYEKEPCRQQTLSDGTRFLDFGSEITGTLRVHATGQAGDRVILRYAEELTPQGRARYDMRCNCTYEEFWTLADGENIFDGYDYKAFRYVEILAEQPESTTVTDVKAVVRHYRFDDNACVLSSNDAVLDQVFALCKNGVKYGSQENYVDCPSREKGQYAGDMTITGASQIYLTGDVCLFRKAIENLAQSQTAVDGMLAVAPGSFMQEIADYSCQFPILLLRYYRHTGDESFLREMVPVCDRLLHFFAAFQREDGLLDGVDSWNLVDWPENQRDHYDFPLTKPIGAGCHAVINAFYVGCVRQIEEIKTILGIPFEPQGEKLRVAFNAVFYRADLGHYADREGGTYGSLHSNVLPLYYGLEPAGEQQKLADYIEQKGMCSGVYMAYFLLKALARCGRYQTVYDLVTGTGSHSWYNMIREGGTTCFEAWGKDEKPNTSLCHPWASAPVSVIIEDLLGVTCLEAGWKKIAVTPHLPDRVTTLDMRIPLTAGVLYVQVRDGRIDWRMEQDRRDT